MNAEKKLIASWLTIFAAVLFWSGYQPYDYLTWVLEVAPAVIGLFLLVVTYKRFQFTGLAYWLILIFSIVLMIGGHYTYARVPLFDWVKEVFDLSRNHYDRMGHILQGFVPAIVTRELLIRTSPLAKSKWLFFIVVSICLAISASYELVEWCAALVNDTAAEAFLGTQGDVWDTQADMALALAGAITAMLVLSKTHDRQLAMKGHLQKNTPNNFAEK